MKKWVLFVLICLIWGSSFILMKLGLYKASGEVALTAIQVAAMRIFSASVVLLPFALKAYRRLSKQQSGLVVLTGLLGSFFPAFLFCIAETRIDSALTAMINASTPIFAVLFAAFMYKKSIPPAQVLGVLLGFAGCIFLFYGNSSIRGTDLYYAGFVVLATVFYGINVNLVKQKLGNIPSRDLAALAFSALLIPSGLILVFSGYFQLPLGDASYIKATSASIVLGVIGTALASVIFYALVKISNSVFASLITYGIPFVAIGWGLLYGETIGLVQILALFIILAGVYIASMPALSVLGIGRKKS